MFCCKIVKNLAGEYRVSFYNSRSDTVDKLTSDKSDRDYELESYHRSKMKVIDYGNNNEWTYFMTITFDPSKHDRTNRLELYKTVRSAFKSYKKHIDSQFRYVALPELHEDGCIHFHGLAYVSPYNMDVKPKYDVEKHCQYFRSDYFYKKFGRFRFDKIATTATYASAYITKYISEQQEKMFGCRYICSKGLNTSTDVGLYISDDALHLRQRIRQPCLHTTGELLNMSIQPVSKSDYTTVYNFTETEFKMLFGDLISGC